jgi:peptidoglycan/LPS O-acetylase OafA/YrhL
VAVCAVAAAKGKDQQGLMRNSSARTFRPDIEGLRGIAVFVVVAFHCGLPGFSGGFIGVDVFFVLSGYLITGLLLQELETTSTIGLLNFYARRVRRLLPASVLMLLVTLAVGALVLAPQELDFAARAARATAVYLGNVFFAQQARDYFAADVRTNPLLHMWSLAVEEQFYLFWPLLMLLLWRRAKSRATLAAAFALLTVVSLIACVWLTVHSRTVAFYALYTRAWEFGIGGLASLVPRGRSGAPASVWGLAGWLGVIAIALSSALLTPAAAFPGWIATIPVVGTALALMAGRELPGQGFARLLDTPPFQYVGELSYSWYLWHWPFLVLGLALLPSLSVFGKAVAALLGFAAAALTHVYVENPIRFQPFLVARRSATLALGAVLALGCIGAAFLALHLAARLSLDPKIALITTATRDIARMSREDCVTLTNSATVRACEFGSLNSPISLVLFGDSHAIQWFDALEHIASEQQWRLVTLLRSGCPAPDLDTPLRSPECDAWRAAAIRKIKTLRPTLVVLASTTRYLGDDDAAEWEGAVRRTLTQITGAGVHVLVIRDTPTPPFNVPTCLARSARHAWYPGGKCTFLRAQALRPQFFAAEQRSAAGLPGVSFADLTDALCDKQLCPASDAGLVIYRDDNHLTGQYAVHLAADLERHVEAAVRPSLEAH